MTVQEFHDNPELGRAWQQELRTNDLLRTVLAVMDEQSPLNDTVALDQSNPEVAALIQYGIVKGYARYTSALKFLGTQPVLAPDPTKLPSTYGVIPKDA